MNHIPPNQQSHSRSSSSSRSCSIDLVQDSGKTTLSSKSFPDALLVTSVKPPIVHVPESVAPSSESPIAIDSTKNSVVDVKYHDSGDTTESEEEQELPSRQPSLPPFLPHRLRLEFAVYPPIPSFRSIPISSNKINRRKYRADDCTLQILPPRKRKSRQKSRKDILAYWNVLDVPYPLRISTIHLEEKPTLWTLREVEQKLVHPRNWLTAMEGGRRVGWRNDTVEKILPNPT